MLITQGNSLVTTTWVGTVMIVNKAWLLRIWRRGKEFKVFYHASAAAVRDGNLPYHDGNLPYCKSNLPYIMATCLYSQY